MTDENHQETALQRRRLLRGGAVLAGAVGATAIGAAVAPTKASAADGDSAVLGEVNLAASTTQLTMNGVRADPVLTLEKASGGPQLRIPPAELFNFLAVGDFQNTPNGPFVGVADGEGVATDYLALGIDLDQLSTAEALTPTRLLDTRTAVGREAIIQTAPSPWDAQFRLKAGCWVDLPIGSVAEPPVEAAFLNVTVTGSTRGGWAVAYPSGPRPNVSTLNFSTGQTIANGTFVATGVVQQTYAVRIFVAAATHVIVDLTGRTILGPRGISGAVPAEAARRSASRSPARRISRAVIRKR